MDAVNRKARERTLRVRFFASIVFMLGAVCLVWIIRRGFVLGSAIHSLNKHIENHALERFLPPVLVHEVAAGRLQLNERPSTRLVTLLAADIVSFTSGTESLGSERIAMILNRFMVAMGSVIFEHQGTIDKFIGDGVIAIFGAPVDMDAETQALQASRCAQAMIKVLDGLNQELLAGHGWKLRLRIGMHQGVALVGSFGTRQRSDYGAIGDAVHIASRIQTVAGPNEVLLTTSVKQHLDGSLCSRRGDLKIRMQSQAIAMHSLSLTADLKAA
jgi:class 3 adenylate cyclase